MFLADIAYEPEHDPALSYDPSRSDPVDVPNTYYSNLFFCYELKKIVNFEVKFSFKWYYRMVVSSLIDIFDNPPSSSLWCV